MKKIIGFIFDKVALSLIISILGAAIFYVYQTEVLSIFSYKIVEQRTSTHSKPISKVDNNPVGNSSSLIVKKTSTKKDSTKSIKSKPSFVVHVSGYPDQSVKQMVQMDIEGLLVNHGVSVALPSSKAFTHSVDVVFNENTQSNKSAYKSSTFSSNCNVTAKVVEVKNNSVLAGVMARTDKKSGVAPGIAFTPEDAAVKCSTNLIDPMKKQLDIKLTELDKRLVH